MAKDISATFDAPPFRHADAKYQCCCKQIHCKAGVRYILLLGIVGLIINIVSMILNYQELTMFIVHLVFTVIAAVALAFLAWAIKKEDEKFTLPYLGYMVLSVVVLLSLVVLSLWSLIEPTSEPARVVNGLLADPQASNATLVSEEGQLHDMENNRTAIQVFSAVSLAMCLAGIAVSIWFALVVYKYYVYLKDMKNARIPARVVHHEKEGEKVTHTVLD